VNVSIPKIQSILPISNSHSSMGNRVPWTTNELSFYFNLEIKFNLHISTTKTSLNFHSRKGSNEKNLKNHRSFEICRKPGDWLCFRNQKLEEKLCKAMLILAWGNSHVWERVWVGDGLGSHLELSILRCTLLHVTSPSNFSYQFLLHGAEPALLMAATNTALLVITTVTRSLATRNSSLPIQLGSVSIFEKMLQFLQSSLRHDKKCVYNVCYG
jgi:hypothetical protein